MSVSGGGDAGGHGQDVSDVSAEQSDVLLQQGPDTQQLWICTSNRGGSLRARLNTLWHLDKHLEEGLTVSVDALGAAGAQVQFADQQPLEAQQQVQRRRALLADLLGLEIVGDPASDVLQPGDGLRRDVPAGITREKVPEAGDSERQAGGTERSRYLSSCCTSCTSGRLCFPADS